MVVCHANNSLGSINHTFAITVQTPPKFLEDSNKGATHKSNHLETELIARSGESVSLKCPFTGNPEPEIRWNVADGDDGLLEETEILTTNSTLVRLKQFQ